MSPDLVERIVIVQRPSPVNRDIVFVGCDFFNFFSFFGVADELLM